MERPFKANYAGAIYGTILSMAVIAGLSTDPSIRPVPMAIWAAVTAIVFWVAHVFSRYVTSPEAYTASSRGLLRSAMSHDWPMVQGALIPALALLLAPAGLVSDNAASYVAVGVGVAVLFGAGLQVGRHQSLGVSRTLLTGTINALIGLVIVLLKMFVH